MKVNWNEKMERWGLWVDKAQQKSCCKVIILALLCWYRKRKFKFSPRNKSSLPSDNLNQDSADLDDEIPIIWKNIQKQLICPYFWWNELIISYAMSKRFTENYLCNVQRWIWLSNLLESLHSRRCNW